MKEKFGPSPNWVLIYSEARDLDVYLDYVLLVQKLVYNIAKGNPVRHGVQNTYADPTQTLVFVSAMSVHIT